MSEANSKTAGRRIYLAGLIKLENFIFPRFYFFVMDKYRFTYNLQTFRFSHCECEYGSFFGVNKQNDEKDPKYCRHVEAAREWLKEKGSTYLKDKKQQMRLK